MSELNARRQKKSIAAEGVGSATPSSSEEQFINNCLERCAEWMRHYKAKLKEDDVAALFLFHPVDGLTRAPSDLEQRFAFHEDFPRGVCGNVYYCAHTLRRVQASPFAWSDTDEPLSWLNDNGLLGYCAVIFLPGASKILVHRAGESLELVFSQSLEGMAGDVGPFTLDEVPKLLEDFHEEYTKTPDSSLPMWLSQSKHPFRHEPEKLIHHALYAFLKLKIPRRQAKIFREVRVPGGREDLEVLIKEDGKEFQSSILELKVLHPNDSEQKNEAWAISGIGQLTDYRDKRKGDVDVESARLCCYDARWEKGATLISNVTSKSLTEDVTPHFYSMQTPQKKEKKPATEGNPKAGQKRRKRGSGRGPGAPAVM